MPTKLSKRVPCAFCTGPTDRVLIGAYVELEVTVPESEGQQRQLFGAHTACLTRAMRDGRQVEVDLLIEPLRLGEAPGAEPTDEGCNRKADRLLCSTAVCSCWVGSASAGRVCRARIWVRRPDGDY